MRLKNYYETKDFARLANVTSKTLGRLKERILKENPHTAKIKHGSKPHKFHHSLLKEYLSPDFYKVMLDNRSLRNTISCLRDSDSLGYRLFKMEWTWWCTVSYQQELPASACRIFMDDLYNQLEMKYGDRCVLRMFYTTESYSVRDGNHNHFVLYVSEPSLHFEIRQEMLAIIGANQFDIQKYDEEKPCVFYSCKEGMSGTEWDLWGNNLKEEAANYENQSYRTAV